MQNQSGRNAILFASKSAWRSCRQHALQSDACAGSLASTRRLWSGRIARALKLPIELARPARQLSQITMPPMLASFCDAAALFRKSLNDVIEHWLDKTRMGIDELSVDIALLEFYGGQRLLQGDLVVGGDFLADQAQGVAIGDGGVVVVFVDVVAEQGREL